MKIQDQITELHGWATDILNGPNAHNPLTNDSRRAILLESAAQSLESIPLLVEALKHVVAIGDDETLKDKEIPYHLNWELIRQALKEAGE